MRTEEMQRSVRNRDPHEVSRALQELTPLSCAIVDRRGRPVPLTSAGYLLRFGKSYHLRTSLPFPDEDIREVRIITPPSVIKVEREILEVDEQGRKVRAIPFKVSLDLWGQLRKLGMGIYGEDLDLATYFHAAVRREAPVFQCPIVVRPRWTGIFVGVLLAFLVTILDKLVAGFFSHEQPTEHLRHFLDTAFRGDFWFWMIVIALLVWLGVNLVNLALLYRRSRELQESFLENYPVAVE